LTKNFKAKPQEEKSFVCKTFSYGKVARKMLVKLTPVVDFNNILRATFTSKDHKSAKI